MPRKKIFGMKQFPRRSVSMEATDIQQLLVSKDEDSPEDWNQDDPSESPHIKEEQEKLWTNQEGEQLQGLEVADSAKAFRFQDLTDLFKQQLLTAAREDLMEHFQATISEYEKELNRQHRLLDLVLKPEIRLQRAVLPADVQQLLVSKDEDSPEDWNQEDPPEPPHIKKEQEELWTNQEGEQLQGLEVADSAKAFRFQVLKDLFKQQLLTAAREDLMEHFQTTISEYEKELDRQHRLLDLVLKPEIRLQRADAQQLLVRTDEVSPEDWTQEDPPEPPQIKQEQDELWTNQNGEQLPGLEEGAITMFTLTTVSVKSENDDEKKPQSSQLHQRQTEQMKTEANEEDCRLEPTMNSDPDGQPDTDDKTEDSSEPDTDHENDCQEPDRKSFPCSFCGKTFNHKGNLNIHLRTHTGVKPFSCSFCGKGFTQKGGLDYHLKTHTGEKPFSCSFCNKTYRHKAALTYHLVAHTGVKPYSCGKCGKTFRGTSQLKIHKCVGDSAQSHRKQSNKCKKPLTCSECNTTFPNNYLLVTHIRMHKGKKLFTCTICGAKRQFSSHLEIHMRTHTGEKPYSCSICGKTFSQRGIVKQHMAIHSGVKPYSCSDCGRGFFWQFQIKKHKCRSKTQLQRQKNCGEPEPIRIFNPFRHLRHNKETISGVETDDSVDTDFWKETRQHQSGFTYRRNKVSVSDGYNTSKKTFNSSDNLLKIEANTDDDTNPHYCHQTGQSGVNHLKHEVSASDAGFNTGRNPISSSAHHRRSEESHTLHTRRKFYSIEKPFSCLFCKKEFASGGSLTRHISIHMGEKLLSCVVCDKTFSLKSEFLSHECVSESSQLHQSQTVGQIAGYKSFSCSHCGKGFDRKQHLQIHLRSHTGEKPFSCSVCGKTFARRESLSFHMACHTGEKPFHCSVCNTGFIDSESLIKHMRIHTRQTQFSCLVCGKEFAWRRYLTKHMEVHSDVIYSCSVCDLEFTQIDQFKTHQCLDESSQFRQIEENRPPQVGSSPTEQMETEADEEDHGRPESTKTSDPDSHLQLDTNNETEDSSKPEIKVSDDDWEGTGKPASSLNCHFLETLKKNNKLSGTSICMDQLTKSGCHNMVVYRGVHKGPREEDPEPSHIKEEQEEFWISQEGEQPQGLEEANITKFTFTAVPVKSEDDDDDDDDDEEKAQSSQLHQRQTERLKTEADEEDCGGPEPARTSDPDTDVSVDSDFWKETRERPSDLNSLKNDEISECVTGCDSVKVLNCSDEKPSDLHDPESEDTVDSDFWTDNQKPRKIRKKPYNCSECGRRFLQIHHLKNHMRFHVRQRAPFFCSVCGHQCLYKSLLKIHMRTHTGEKPFICPVCGNKYAHKASMQTHMTVHTVEKQYTCNICDKNFAWYTELKYHECVGKT